MGDEIVDDTVEENAVIQVILHVLNHVFNRDRRPHWEHLDDDLALLVALEVAGLVVDIDHQHRIPSVRVVHGRALQFRAVVPHRRVQFRRAPILLRTDASWGGQHPEQEHGEKRRLRTLPLAHTPHRMHLHMKHPPKQAAAR